MICQNCGRDIPGDSSFCPDCGAWLGGMGVHLQDDGGPEEPFDNETFKNRGKEALNKNYWPAFLVSLIAAILTGALDTYEYVNRYTEAGGSGYSPGPRFIILTIFGSLFILVLAYSIFIANTVEVGSAKYFLNLRQRRGTVSNVFYAFQGRQYLPIVGAMAWRSLFIFLWSLLLIIPGIVKSYAYILVPYILAENPHIGYDRALKLSMRITYGYKLSIFVLQLSFLGWYILGLLCLGVGVLFVHPYYNATMAEMYITLRDNAIKRGICTLADFTIG